MSRVITYSRLFPKYHPRKGEPTYFVEKVLNSNKIPYRQNWYFDELKRLNPDLQESIIETFFLSLNWKIKEEKPHTIRAGNRWKVGYKFSPRVWGNNVNPKSGKSGPYQSKQIIIAPDIEVKKMWEFDICGSDHFLDGKREFATSGDSFDLTEVANNDGLEVTDFDNWFSLSPEFIKTEQFNGQIICYNDKIEY